MNLEPAKEECGALNGRIPVVPGIERQPNQSVVHPERLQRLAFVQAKGIRVGATCHCNGDYAKDQRPNRYLAAPSGTESSLYRCVIAQGRQKFPIKRADECRPAPIYPTGSATA